MNPYNFNNETAAKVCEYLTNYEINYTNIYERFGAACGLMVSMAEKIGGLWLWGYDTTNDRDALTFAASRLFMRAEAEALAIYKATAAEWGEEDARLELDRRSAQIREHYAKIMHFVNNDTNHINANGPKDAEQDTTPAEEVTTAEDTTPAEEQHENRTTAIINRVKESAQALAVRAAKGWQFVKACAVGLFGWSFVLLLVACLLSLPYILYLMGAEVAKAPEMITAGQWVVLFCVLCVMAGGGFASVYVLREIFKYGI